MKEYFSVADVAKLLKISRSGVLYYIKTGKLKAERVGRIFIISQEEFGDFLKSNKEHKKRKPDSQPKLDF